MTVKKPKGEEGKASVLLLSRDYTHWTSPELPASFLFHPQGPRPEAAMLEGLAEDRA